MRPELALATKLDGAQIVATCSNELAATLASLPVQPNEHWAFLQLGATATVGAPLPEALTSHAACAAGLSHTLGHSNAVYGHLETHGLQILEEFRLLWAGADPNMDSSALGHLSATAEPLQSIIDLTDPRFATSDDLVAKIQAYCRETDQVVPRKPGPIYRCLMESVAFLFRRKLDEISMLTGHEFTHLHLVGDSSHSILNHFIANAVELPVFVAPANPAALGNILLQAIALGKIQNQEEANQINLQSFKRPMIMPNPMATWSPAYERLLDYSKLRMEATPA